MATCTFVIIIIVLRCYNMTQMQKWFDLLNAFIADMKGASIDVIMNFAEAMGSNQHPFRLVSIKNYAVFVSIFFSHMPSILRIVKLVYRCYYHNIVRISQCSHELKTNITS